jgi:hypothetical protein
MKRVAVPAALVLLSCLFALLCFELVLRAAGYSAPIWYGPDPLLGWRLRPGLAAWWTGEGRGFVEVNAAGLRDREHRTEKPAGVYRIAVLGDSYAEARQFEAREAFWALLPGRLQQCGFAPGKTIEALNFGISGYGTAQEYLMLESTALGYRPDLVLLQFTNGNDVRNNSPALEEEKDRPFFVAGADGRLALDASFAARDSFRSRTSARSELVRNATDRSRVLQLVRFVREMSFVPKASASQDGGIEQGLEPFVLAPPRDPQWQQAWSVTEQLLARTAELARRNGAGFMMVTVPYAIQVHPEREVREALRAKLGVPDLLYPDSRIAEFAARRGIRALPLAPQMQRLAEEQGAFFHGFAKTGMGRGHWNADGHRAAAEIIAQHLCGRPL